MQNKINVIFGPTASGKTAYGINMAKKIGGEIINSDSMQVYKHFEILTAQPEQNEKAGVPHHNFGCITPDKNFSVVDWLKITIEKIEDIRKRQNTPILVGGTGMYLKSLVDGISEIPEIPKDFETSYMSSIENLSNFELHYLLKEKDPEKFLEYNQNDRQRILRAIMVSEYTKFSLSHWQKKPKKKPFNREDFHFIFLKPNRDLLYQKINKRFDIMIDKGVVEEVRFILNNFDFNKLPKAHGLPEIRSYIAGLITLDESIERAKQITRNYAKRQFTWARHQFEFDEVVEV